MIIFSRHGNTFEPGEKAVWIGTRTDLPLTADGRTQAAQVVDYLRGTGTVPKQVLAGPLRRTRDFAGIVASAFGLSLRIDDDLRELDYGEWEGLDSVAVSNRFGGDVLTAWEEGLTWPGSSSGWGESPGMVTARVQATLDRLTKMEQPVFACTSNGILRFVWMLTRGSVNLHRSKVRTGAICLLKANAKGFDVLEWNNSPFAKVETNV